MQELQYFYDANDTFKLAIQADSMNVEAFTAWGDLLAEKYNYPEAVASYEDALNNYGPLGCGIYTSYDFYHYGSGILHECRDEHNCPYPHSHPSKLCNLNSDTTINDTNFIVIKICFKIYIQF